MGVQNGESLKSKVQKSNFGQNQTLFTKCTFILLINVHVCCIYRFVPDSNVPIISMPNLIMGAKLSLSGIRRGNLTKKLWCTWV